MQDTTPKLITAEEFNIKVRSWTFRTRTKIVNNAPVSDGELSPKRETKRLSVSIDSSTKKYGIEIGKIRFGFERHGVFVHYGVGRGYIRQGNTVIRGSKKNERVRSTGFHRKPNDWFDIEIKRGFNDLANITQEYHGDKAMENLLSAMDKNKMLIQKK